MNEPTDLVDLLAQQLPVLGVGASLSFGVEPDPVVLARAEGGPDFIEYAGAVDPRPMLASIRSLHDEGIPVLFHPSCLNLCGPWSNPPSWVGAVDQHVRTVRSSWLAQDVSVCFVGNTPGYSIQLGYFIPPERTEAGLAEAVTRVREVRDAVCVPLLLEPAPATFRWGDMPMLQWLDRLCDETGCGMLLDAGHVLSHQLLEGGDPLDGVDLRRVFEVHVAGGIIHSTPDGSRYQDAHELPIQPEVWDVFLRLLRSCPNLKAVCVECEGAAAHTVLPVLAQVRQAVAIHARSEGLRARLRSGVRPPIPEVEAPPTVPAHDPQPHPETHFPALVRLLFDADARRLLADGGATIAAELELPQSLLDGLDASGLALDADGRRRYLMSAVCRAFPLSSAVVGARPGGAERLASFLLSPDLFGTVTDRSAAFGRHLRRLAEFDPQDDPRVQQAIVAVIDYEQALVRNAASVRATVARGEAVRPPHAPDRATRRHGRIALPEFCFVAELPQPMAAMQAALDGLTAGDAWLRIARGAIEWPRVLAVLRSTPSPVTVLARAHASGVVHERGGAGGVAPLVDVAQRTVELRGRKGRWIQSVAGERMKDLPPAQRRLVEQLLEAGVLTMEPA